MTPLQEKIEEEYFKKFTSGDLHNIDCEALGEDDELHPEECNCDIATIKSFVTTTVYKMIVEDLKKWATDYDSTRGVQQSDNYQIGQNHGRQEVIRDLLSHLQGEIT